MSQKQIHHPQKEERKETPEVRPNPEVVKKGEGLKKDIDDLLDKVDGILEENAEEFVKNYIQKGGE